MSGDMHDADDADFLDEDFVVEDIAGKNEDLEDLFVAPGPAPASSAPGGADADERSAADPDADGSAVPGVTPAASAGDGAHEGAADAGADEEDMLFTDHTVGLDPSERFGERPGFAEEAHTGWSGDALDLDEVGVPNASTAAEAAALAAEIAQAKDSFTAELDSMLRADEDFALDSDKDLEVIRDESAGDGVSEFEQSGPFVLDDGDGLWRDELAEREAASAAAGGDRFDDGAAAPELDGADEVAMPLREAAAYAGDGDEAGGWEPLPGTTVDQLSEVGEVQRADDDYVAAPAAAADEPIEDLEDVDGHDIYADDDGEDDAVVVGGATARRGRVLHLFASLAASLLILGGGAAVVMRPEWFGLEFEPVRVERVEVPRPRVMVAVDEPPTPTADPTSDGSAGGGEVVTPPAGQGGTDPAGGQPSDPAGPNDPPNPTGGEPTADPTTADPTTTDPTTPVPTTPGDGGQPNGAGDPAPSTPPGGGIAGTVPAGPGDPDSGAPNGDDPNRGAPGNDSSAVAQPGPTPSGPDGPAVPAVPQGAIEVPVDPAASAWPVASGPGTDGAQAADGPPLVRFGEGLLVGELDGAGGRPVAAVDGVLPGSRAFAQLRNGNYFIGSVKCVVGDTITLHVDSGEVTLATAEIVRLTELGSADYEALQKATRGFVRLTNNNRLIGGILSRIADDHVVLEFRSNRVMLPKSAVGEIVQGEAEAGVRLDTTREEDRWLQTLVERQLGTGKGVAVETEPSAGDRTHRAGGPPR